MARKQSPSDSLRTTIVLSPQVDTLLRAIRAKCITTAKAIPSNSKLIDTLLYLAVKNQNPQEVADTVIAEIRRSKK